MMKPYIPTLSKIWGWCEISHEQMRRLRGKKKKKKKKSLVLSAAEEDVVWMESVSR